MGDKAKLRKAGLAAATGGGSLLLEGITDPFTRPAEKAAREAKQGAMMEQKAIGRQTAMENARKLESESDINRRKALASASNRSLLSRTLG